MQPANSKMEETAVSSAFISGVSSGIGHSLAKRLLARGDIVYGVSRRMPADLAKHPNFRFQYVDFNATAIAANAIGNLLNEERISSLQNVFLNAGQFGRRIAKLNDIPLSELEELMRVNVWSHKLVLDAILSRGIAIGNAVFSASIAGVRARAGKGGYAITKAALNMMAKLYSLEHPDIRFLVLGLCVVDTHLSTSVGNLPLEGHFPDIVRLRERALGRGYMVSPDERADDIIGLLDDESGLRAPNGDFTEIRTLLG